MTTSIKKLGLLSLLMLTSFIAFGMDYDYEDASSEIHASNKNLAVIKEIKRLVQEGQIILPDSSDAVDRIIAIREKAKDLIERITPDSSETVNQIQQLRELVKSKLGGY
jgi:hypothetical protein